MNEDLAKVAERNIRVNNLSSLIKVVPKRSTDLTKEDMNHRLADIIVTETLDSHLLMEGIFQTIHHARNFLSTTEVVVIPHSAQVYMHLCEYTLNELELSSANTSSVHFCTKKVFDF